MTRLSATAFSIKPGGSAREVVITGGLRTHGKGIAPLELHGSIGRLSIEGGFGPEGNGFETI